MVSVSTLAFSGSDLFEFVDKLQKAGDTQTELELFFDTRPFSEANYYQKYLGTFLNSGRIGMHCPIIGCDFLADEGSLLLQYSMDKHHECLEIAARVNASYMILHTNGAVPIDETEIPKKRKLFEERATLFAQTAWQYGCQLWIENVGFQNSGNLVFDEESYTDLILSNSSFHSLIDIGHAHINGWNIPMLLSKLNDSIKGFHVHDNDGISDTHLPFFKGNIKWKPIFNAMQNLPGDLVSILEYMPHTPCEDLISGINLLRKYLD